MRTNSNQETTKNSHYGSSQGGKGYINNSLVAYKPKANKKETSCKALKRDPGESTAPARNGVPGTKLQSCRLLVLVSGSM